jgi:hypothetical protein
MQTDDESRRGAAFHEAGHAVVAWALKLPVRRLVIGIDGDPSKGAQRSRKTLSWP